MSSLTISWSGTFPAGTTYYLRLCGEEDPELYQFLGFTTELSYAFTGLAANTSYYAYVSTEEAGGFILAGAAATRIETPASVYFDEIGTTTVVASAYAASLSGLDLGVSGAALTAGAGYGAWTSGGNAWTVKTAMPTARHGAAAAAIGGKIYVVGGFSTAQTGLNEEYDPVANTWTTKAAMPTARRYHGAAAANGILYAIGGENNTVYGKNEAYDPVTNTWATKASMSQVRYDVGVAAVNGKVYAIGGNNTGLITANQEYNPQTNTWSNKAALPQGRDQFAIGVVNGKIYMAGGMELVTSSRTEEYNPVTNTWTQKAYMPSVRYGLAGAGLGGKFYAVGGMNGVNVGLNYEYDPQADAWSARASMPTARRYPAVAAVGGRLYAAGGIASGNTAANEEYYPGAAGVVTGLQPNTLYAFKAKARNQAGVETGESSTVSTYTLATVGGGAFSNISSVALTVSWSSGSAAGGYNGPGASYLIQASTSASFSGTLLSSAATGLSASFTGLGGGTAYYFRAKATNAAGVLNPSWTTLGSAVTDGGLVGYWKFDEGSGGAIADQSGFGNSATVVGSSWTGSGKTGSALSYDGVNDYVEVPDSPSLNPYGGITVAAWVYLNQYKAPLTSNHIVVKDDMITGKRDYLLQVGFFGSGDVAQFSVFTASGIAEATGGSVGLNAWHHIAGTYDGHLVKLYVDGALVNSAVYDKPAGTGFVNTDTPLKFGASDNSAYNRFMNGKIDEVKIYGRALSASELADGFNSYKPPLASIALSPASTTVVVGSTVQFSAVGNFVDGSTLALRAVDGAVWSVSAASVATVGAEGLAAAVAPGDTQVTVAVGTVSASAALTAYVQAIGAAPVTGVSTSALMVNWSTSFSGGTPYYVRLSTTGSADVYVASGSTTGLSYGFTGLAANTSYYGYVSTAADSGYQFTGSAVTLANVPDAAMVEGLGVSSVTVLWGDGGNPAGTEYYAELSTDSAFGGTVYAAAATTTTRASFEGLAPGTFYYGRARARNHAGIYSEYGQANFSLTFAAQPSSAAYTSVGVSTIAFSWNANGNQAGTPFSAELSTAADFSVGMSSFTDLTSAAFYGLVPNTTYYARVRTLGTPSSAYTVLAATVTRASPPGTGVVANITGSVLGTASVRWAWGAGTVTSADGFVLFSTANVFIASAPFSQAGGTYTQTGLGANRPVSVKIAPFVAGDIGELRQGPTYYTFAAVPDGIISALVIGTNAVYGEWADLVNPPGTLYQLWRATAADFGGADISTVTASPHVITGLTPNTRYFGRARAVNGDGIPGGFTAAASASTLANPPSGAAAAAVYTTSVTLTWNLNGNPAGSTAWLQRTGDGSLFNSFGTSLTDTRLLGCTTYQYALWYVNAADVQTSKVYISSVVTAAPVPLPPGALYAQPLSGNRILLNWAPAPFEGITGYKLYYDNGAGSVDYNSPLAQLPAGQSSYTTGVLTSSAAYKFGLHAVHRCGREDDNRTVLAVAPSRGSLAGVSAAIKIPQTGKRVNGNSVTVMAELVTGTPADVKNILFQYKASGNTVWNNIVAANANHPNPDVTDPYFVHWNVELLTPGDYDLRAQATDLGNAQDSSPAAITITVDAVEPDITESTQGNGDVKKEQKVSNLVDNTLHAGDATSTQLTRLQIPAGALDDSTATVSVVNSPSVAPPDPAGATPTGVIAEVTLTNQTVLAGGLTAEVTLSYPDADNNGLVDGTNILADQLVMYSASSAAGPWNKDLNSAVDKVNKKVTGNTSHFSYFALFAPLAANLNSARAYPVPWRPGSSGAYDSPTGAAGIVFDNLTDYAEIKIFTVTGQLVRELSVKPADLGYKVWDGKNSAGYKAASGMYLAHIKAGGKVKVIKVAIER